MRPETGRMAVQASFHANGTPCHQRCDKMHGDYQEIAINVHNGLHDYDP
jgi:hypothetical protein